MSKPQLRHVGTVNAVRNLPSAFAAAAASAIALAAGCHLVTGAGDLFIREDGSGASGTGASGVGGAGAAAGGSGAQGGAVQGGGGSGAQGGAAQGGGGEGGAPSCTEPAGCPGVDALCRYRTCEGGLCGLKNAPQGTICEGGGSCDGSGVCLNKGAGYPCSAAPECVSGKCVDGVCCTTPCDGPCQACAAAKTGGANGTCDFVTAGTDPDDDCGPDVCTGSGLCRCADSALNGDETDVDCGGGACPGCGVAKSCLVPADCASGFCPADDGICCSAACDGACEGCNAKGSQGTCKPHAPGTDPDLECAPGVCDAVGTCATGKHLWSKRFGEAFDQEPMGIAIDASGNALLTGILTGTVDFGGGALASAGYDIFVAKLDKDGKHLWSKRFGDANTQYATGVAGDAQGNVVVTGELVGTVDFGGGPLTNPGGGYNDIFVAKLDKDGTHLWSKRFGDPDDHEYCTSIAADAQKNVLATGYFSRTIDFGGGLLTVVGPGNPDIFVAKLGPDGNHLWSKRFGGTGLQLGSGIAVDGQSRVLVTGAFAGTVDFGGGVLTSAGLTDIFVAKLDPSGTQLWSKRFGDADGQSGKAITADGAGNVLVTGALGGTVDFGGGVLTSAGSWDIFVAKLDSAGNHLWSKRFGDAQYQGGNAVAVDGAGNVLLTGVFVGTVDFGGGVLTSAGKDDIFVAKLDKDGTCLWSKSFGDATSQQAKAVAADGAGNVLLTGSFEGAVDFGGGPLTSAGQRDIFLAKYGP